MNIHTSSSVRKIKSFLYSMIVKAGIYPAVISKRDVSSEIISSEKNSEQRFDKKSYQEINQARMLHLASLGLPLEGKKVLDVGCGPGDLAQFFLERNCEVIGIDGRQENIDKLHSQYPDLPAYVADVQSQPLNEFGTFDVVFCYGLLYHLEDPFSVLRNMASVCRELLLLETMICDHISPILQLVDEPFIATQALQGVGCRPSPSYIALALNRVGMPFVYMSKTRPEHPQFQFKWKNNLDWRRRYAMRAIFVASKKKLENPYLVDLLQD